METPEMVVGADIDVKQLMREITAEVERKREQGLYPPDLLEDLDAIAGTDHASTDEALNRAMVLFRQSSVFSSVVETGSRIPVVAPVAAAYKRAVVKSTSWYIAGVLGQVHNFAGHAIRVMGMLADRIRQLDERIDVEIKRTTNTLRDETAGIAQAIQVRVDALEIESGNVRARDRIALLERSVRALEQRLADGVPSVANGQVVSEPNAKVELDIDYVDFENIFRGSEEVIRDRQRSYVDVFADAPGPVVDLGCGRGEFLELARDASIDAYGVDRNPGMVARCEEKGLRAQEGDLLQHLASVPGASLGGVFSAQTIEHLNIRDVPRLFELAADAIAPGGRLVIETLNPESLFIFASAFYVDLGHLRPLHPLTLRFLAEKSAFRDVEIAYSATPDDGIRTNDLELSGTEPLDTVIRDANENFRRINKIVFGPQDFAIIATR
jgi:O-antigen chain-terminating methyltransferase